MAEKLYKRNPQARRSCTEGGHRWAQFGPGMAQAMAHEEGAQEFLICIYCDKERFIRDSRSVFAERQGVTEFVGHFCAPGTCEGGHARRTVGTEDIRKTKPKRSKPVDELPPDEGAIRL